jgi:hypothetical protein
MRAFLGLALAAMAVLAGCTQPADEPTPPADPVDNAYHVPAVPAVDAVQLLADHAKFVTANGERADNLPTHESARKDLLAAFDSFGLESYRHNFTTGALANQANIVGIQWGVQRDQWVVVGGHYDTVTDDCLVGGTPDPLPPAENPCALRALSQGAYDDGSGTMMTVHLARQFANATPYYTIAYVLFDGEELGTQGAAAFVRDFMTEAEHDDGTFATPYGHVDIVGDVDLDMIGINWPGTWNPINVMTNSELLWKEVQNKTGALGFPDGQVVRKDGLQLGSSDYARFWEVGKDEGGPIPTVFFISAFEEVAAPGDSPQDVHTPAPAGVYPFWHLEDTVETMTAMAGGEANLVKGFQSATEVAAHMLHLLAFQNDVTVDATVVTA